MRLDRWPGSTWLLATLAGWALLVWLLALAGLGGRIAAAGAAADAAPPVALPALPAPAPAPPPDPGHYAQIAARPVFSPDRQPRVFRRTSAAQPLVAGDVRLTGVLITPTLQMATLQTPAGASLRLQLDGPEVAGWRLVALQPRAAELEGAAGRRRLELQPQGARAPAPAVPPTTPSATPAARAGPAGPAAEDAAAPRALEPAATTPEQIEAIRQRIEERRRQLQQEQAPAPASATPP
jgi:general secretion pathway protein N